MSSGSRLVRWAVLGTTVAIYATACGGGTDPSSNGDTTVDTVPRSVTTAPTPTTSASTTIVAATTTTHPTATTVTSGECTFADPGVSERSQWWRPMQIDGVLYRLDAVTGGVDQIGAVPAGATGAPVVTPSTTLFPAGRTSTEEGSTLTVLDLEGNSMTIELPGIGAPRLEGVFGDVLVLNGVSTRNKYPAVVAYDLASAQVLWTTVLEPEPDTPLGEVDATRPWSPSIVVSPDQTMAIVRTAYPESGDYDVLITSGGDLASAAYTPDGKLTSELGTTPDRGAGWYDDKMLLYVPYDDDPYLVDIETKARAPLQLPSVDGFEEVYASGDGRHLIAAREGVALVDVVESEVMPIVPASCDARIAGLAHEG